MKTVPLSEWVHELESGARPKGGIKDGEGEVPSLGAEHLADDGGFNFAKDKRIPYEFFLTMKKGRVHPEDILIVKDGATTGKVSFVSGDFPYEEAAINEHVFRLDISRKKADPRFVFRYLQSPLGQQQIMSDFRGATVGGIGRTFLDKVFLPDVVLSEQRRIAAILDKADAVRRKREQALVLADDFLRSVFLGMFGRPKQPNPALKTRPLGEVCSLFAGNSLPAGEPYSGQGGGYLLLKVGDLNLPGNDQTVMSARQWLSEKARTGAAIVAPKDAIVFPKRGGAIATNKKRVLGRSCILDPNLMAVAPKPDSPVSFPYLRVWFELLDLASISNGSTVPQLNKGDLYPLEMSMPDKENLLAFDRLFHGVNRVRAKHADDLISAAALFSSLSQRAFRGEL
jgi:type I restriction enzyme S subunit